MEKVAYHVDFKYKKNKEIIEEIGGEIVWESVFFETFSVVLTEKQAEELRKHPEIEHVIYPTICGTWWD